METFIDEEGLIRHSGRKTQYGIEIKNWTIESRHGRMATDKEMDELKSLLGGVKAVPEIVFLNNTLSLKHTSKKFALHFSAMDALKEWKQQDLPPFQISIAEDWQTEREEDIKKYSVQQLKYDWTFTTPYRGTMSTSTAEFVNSKRGLDTEALKSKDDPILFYDDVVLYETELNDMGVSQCRVLIRVMPKYWFVLLRFFLRIDDNLIRLRETRYFSDFGEGSEVEVMRDSKHWEITERDMRDRGQPDDPNSRQDGQSASSLLRSIIPVGLTVDECENLRFSCIS